MAQTSVYNLEGKKVSEMELSKDIFGVKEKPVLIAQALLAQLANARKAIANTKTRGEVSGGGKKPWKQKGTGRARAGSTRSPLWIGGGITFGPTSERNFSVRFPQKMRNAAIRMVLSQKATEEKIIVLDALTLDKPSTKEFNQIITKLPFEAGRILLILTKVEPNIELSAANIPFVKIIKADNINLKDITNHKYILITTEGLDRMTKILSGEANQETRKDK